MEFLKEEGRIYIQDENGKDIAEITYKSEGEDIVNANHTFVDPVLRGQGIAEKLVEELVKEMEEAGQKIKPGCPYVRDLFERKPDKYGHIAAN